MTLAQSKKITRQELEKLGFVENRYTPNMLEYFGRDAAHEFICAFFNKGTENQTIPNEIHVCGLNNDVSICEEDDMTYEILHDAIQLVFSREIARGGQKNMSELQAKLNSGCYRILANVDYLHRRFMEKADKFFDNVNDVEQEGYVSICGRFTQDFRNDFKKAVTNEF